MKKKLILAFTLLSIFLLSACEISTMKTFVSENVKTDTNNNCEEWAKDLIPNYLLASEPEMWWRSDYDIEINGPNVWRNDVSINQMGIRKGVNMGENINYYYGDGSLTFSESVVDENGNILGSRDFSISPVLKLLDKDYDFTYNVIDLENYRCKILVEYHGFTEEIKKIFDTDEIRISIYYPGNNNDQCIFISKNETGNFECTQKGRGFEGVSMVEVSPNLNQFKIFEIIDTNLISCNYIKGISLTNYNKKNEVTTTTEETTTAEITTSTKITITTTTVSTTTTTTLSDLEYYQSQNPDKTCYEKAPGMIACG